MLEYGRLSFARTVPLPNTHILSRHTMARQLLLLPEPHDTHPAAPQPRAPRPAVGVPPQCGAGDSQPPMACPEPAGAPRAEASRRRAAPIRHHRSTAAPPLRAEKSRAAAARTRFSRSPPRNRRRPHARRSRILICAAAAAASHPLSSHACGRDAAARRDSEGVTRCGAWGSPRAGSAGRSSGPEMCAAAGPGHTPSP